MRLLNTFLGLFFVLSINAQIKNGLYRVKNYKTERYVYVLDNTGSINYSTTSADMGAMELWKDLDRCIDNPASIIQVVNVGNNNYDLQSQGTGVHDIISHYVTIYPYGDGTYQLYASNGSLGKYLSDEETTNVPDGQLGTTNKGEYRRWLPIPMDTESNYFGLRPSLQCGSKFYQTFYADFRIKTLGEGMKAYTVKEIYKHIVAIEEITDEVIPANTPVLIECSSNQAGDNKLELFVRDKSQLGRTNLLKGVYFNNPYRPKSKDARTAYNGNTMRVLGLTENGEIGFVMSSDPYIAANSAYLQVPEGTASELVFMSPEELEKYKLESGIIGVSGVSVAKAVYTLSGLKVAEKVEDLHTLPAGIYIVNGKKVIR